MNHNDRLQAGIYFASNGRYGRLPLRWWFMGMLNRLVRNLDQQHKENDNAEDHQSIPEEL